MREEEGRLTKLQLKKPFRNSKPKEKSLSCPNKNMRAHHCQKEEK
jgi:hypothetical protein